MNLQMNMPGFAAEASLPEIRKSYRTNGVVLASKDSPVVPQQRRFDMGFGRSLSLPPRTVFFQCGWNPHTLTSECTCSGDRDCNRMFESGFCGANASCDTGAGTCRCDLAW